MTSPPKKADITPNSPSPLVTTTTTALPTNTSTTSLPQYYDSEPSSQPPSYAHQTSQSTTLSPSLSLHKRPKSTLASYHAPASAQTVAAVLALPTASQRQLDAEKRTWSERWKAWKQRHFGVWADSGSNNEWNVYGVGVGNWSTRMALKGPGMLGGRTRGK